MTWIKTTNENERVVFCNKSKNEWITLNLMKDVDTRKLHLGPKWYFTKSNRKQGPLLSGPCQGRTKTEAIEYVKQYMDLKEPTEWIRCKDQMIHEEENRQ